LKLGLLIWYFRVFNVYNNSDFLFYWSSLRNGRLNHQYFGFHQYVFNRNIGNEDSADP